MRERRERRERDRERERNTENANGQLGDKQKSNNQILTVQFFFS
jgi:hypothetical protein